MIKLKQLLSEQIRFSDNYETMFIPSSKGDWKVSVFKFVRNGQVKYNWDIISPPDSHRMYGNHKMGIGGTVHLGTSTMNVEQTYADLRDNLKKLGLPYTSITQLKVRDTSKPEEREFVDKLKAAVADFSKEMSKPENQPKDFGKGPPDYGQWLTAPDVSNGRLKWVIENYGDFWLIIKWAASPRQQIKASEWLKNYDKISQGREAAGDYMREIFVRKNPFEGI